MASIVLALASLAMPGHVLANEALTTGGGSVTAGSGAGAAGATALLAGAAAAAGAAISTACGAGHSPGPPPQQRANSNTPAGFSGAFGTSKGAPPLGAVGFV